MKLLIILQIYVNSFVNVIKSDTVYTAIDSCHQVQSFPEMKKEKMKFIYANHAYLITYHRYKEIHVKDKRLFHEHTYVCAIGRYFNQNYMIRIHHRAHHQSMWIIPINFVKREYGTMRGFLFTDDPLIINKLKCGDEKANKTVVVAPF